VVCDSLSFLGGQTALPSVGGVFRLTDAKGGTLYRVTMPPTQISSSRQSELEKLKPASYVLPPA
jgi:hypothetical protein